MPNPMESLTAREREVLSGVAAYMTNSEIADRLCIQESTVETHVHHILGKLEVSSRGAAARWAACVGEQNRSHIAVNWKNAVIGVCVASMALVVGGWFAWPGNDPPAGAARAGRATVQGVSLRILRAESTAASTSIVVVADGRDDAGEILDSFTRPVLVDEGAGVRHFALRQANDSVFPRQVRIEFPPLAAGSSWTLLIGDLTFESTASREDRLARAERGLDVGPGNTVTIRGRWSVEVTLSRASERVRDLAASAPYGPGTLTVERVVATVDALTVFGRIDGVRSEEFQVLEIAPASLVANGRTAAFLGGRSGYGPGNASFELRFEPVAGAIGTLSVPFNVVGVNVGGNVSPEASRLAPFAGKATEVVIDLPE